MIARLSILVSLAMVRTQLQKRLPNVRVWTLPLLWGVFASKRETNVLVPVSFSPHGKTVQQAAQNKRDCERVFKTRVCT